MLDALARSIAETTADVLGSRTTQQRAKISDEEIGLYLWHERGFRDHDTLVTLINHTRIALDRPKAAPPSKVRRRQCQPSPVQLALDLVTA
jgi:hypothetical protein